MKRLPLLRFRPSNETPFWRELKDEVQAALAANGDHRHFDAASWLKAGLLAAGSLAAFVLAMSTTRTGAFAAAYIAFLFLAMMLGMNLLHDASHRAVSSSDAMNRFWRRLVALPIGIDSDIWSVRHVRYHHTYANIDGYDLDTDPNPFLRQTPHQAWAPQYRFQHLHWPVVAALSLPYLVWYSDFLDRFGKTPLADDRVLPGVGGWVWFFSAKLTHVGLVIALPAWLLADQVSLATVIGCYLAGQMLASCFLVAMVLGTHWSGVEFFLPPPGGRFGHTFQEHVFRTACDWTARLPQPLPRWIGAWLGGLNWHLTHHLFPGHAHRHYAVLAPIVARVAARHGLSYRDLGYGELLSAQQRFLKTMGAPPPAATYSKHPGDALDAS